MLWMQGKFPEKFYGRDSMGFYEFVQKRFPFWIIYDCTSCKNWLDFLYPIKSDLNLLLSHLRYTKNNIDNKTKVAMHQ